MRLLRHSVECLGEDKANVAISWGGTDVTMAEKVTANTCMLSPSCGEGLFPIPDGHLRNESS
jgi:hypothetical protein